MPETHPEPTMATSTITKPTPARTTRTAQDQSDTVQRTIKPLEVIEPSNADEVEYPTGIKFAAVMISLSLALLMVGLDVSILATAVPRITDEFRTLGDIGWYASAFRLTSCSLQFMFGKFYSLFSVKVVFSIALVIFEAGSVLSASAPTSKALVLGRAVAGIGAAGIIQGIFTMITQCVPLRRRSLYGGLGGGIESLAGIAGPLLGGILTDRLSWRWCFWINLPIGAITFIVVTFLFENPQVNRNMSLPWKDKLKRLDLLGTAVFVPSVTALLLALQWGGSQYGWASARIIALLAVFAALLGLFAYLQYRQGDNATLPPRIMGQRSILFGAWFAGCLNAACSVVDYYMPIYFQAVKEVSAAKSGILTLPLVVGLMISLIFSGALTSAIGYYTPGMFFASLLTPVAAGLMTRIKVDARLGPLICYQALLGFAAGIGFQAPQSAANTVLSTADAPMGIAVIQFMQGLGPAICVSAAQTLFTSRLIADLGEFAPGLNAKALETMGLSDLKKNIGAKNLAGVLLGYDKAVTQTFYLPVALTCLTLVGTLGMEWRSVKKKRE